MVNPSLLNSIHNIILKETFISNDSAKSELNRASQICCYSPFLDMWKWGLEWSLSSALSSGQWHLQLLLYLLLPFVNEFELDDGELDRLTVPGMSLLSCTIAVHAPLPSCTVVVHTLPLWTIAVHAPLFLEDNPIELIWSTDDEWRFSSIKLEGPWDEEPRRSTPAVESKLVPLENLLMKR